MDEQKKSFGDLKSIQREPRVELRSLKEESFAPKAEYEEQTDIAPKRVEESYLRREESYRHEEEPYSYKEESYSYNEEPYGYEEEPYEFEKEPVVRRRAVRSKLQQKVSKHSKKKKVHVNDTDDFEEKNPRIRVGRNGKKKKALNPHLRRLRFFGILTAICLVVAYVSFITMSEFMQDSGKETVLTGVEVEIVIPEGASTIAIAEILKENQLINDTWIFRIKSRIDGYDGTFKQGTYHIDTGLTAEEIMEMLQTGVVYNGDVKFTIPEGYSTTQIAARLEEEGICTAEAFIQAANEDVYEYDFLEGLPEREYRLEGYLFPNTYYVTEDATAYDIVEVMLDGFDAMYNTAYREIVEQGEYTLDEYVTMASIIEKEIAVAEERTTASGVIRNRLESGMMLQMDATVLYAMGIIKEDVTYADLEVDSPYNTYKVTGLPLGPISNPGASSFEAALFPEDNNYLYYVVEAKGQSNHLYFENYDDFLVAKSNYQNS